LTPERRVSAGMTRVKNQQVTREKGRRAGEGEGEGEGGREKEKDGIERERVGGLPSGLYKIVLFGVRIKTHWSFFSFERRME
jgi:hypothetical protein